MNLESDLTFRTVQYGPHETPINLFQLVYKGGAKTDIRRFDKAVATGVLGSPQTERIALVVSIHSVLQDAIAAGGSRFTLKTAVQCLRNFFTWADNNSFSLSLSSAGEAFVHWTDHLLLRHRTRHDLKIVTIAGMATTVSSILDEILELKVGLYYRTSIPKRYNKKKVLGSSADKAKTSDSFRFGHMLCDICSALTLEKIHGELPVTIAFRIGKTLEEWSGLRPASDVKHLIPGHGRAINREKVKKARFDWEKDTSWRTRFPLINLRIQAELLIFIAQTGMNLAQAHKLTLDKFSYQSHLDGYLVRKVYKSRRQGEVAFEIFSDYRQHFEKYIAWRAALFPTMTGGLLFPDSSPQQRPVDRPPTFQTIKSKCQKLDVIYVPPRELRKNRVNWLIRKSRDATLTSEMVQHTQETLIRTYEQPHHQIALSEISQYHNIIDTSFVAPSPGVCINPKPNPTVSIPDGAPNPDCITPSGCLFCDNHRDIDDFDHIWSLISYRHLKILEIIWHKPIGDFQHSPANRTVDRINEKLNSLACAGKHASKWIEESTCRIEEGYFHPKWDGFIKLIEQKS